MDILKYVPEIITRNSTWKEFIEGAQYLNDKEVKKYIDLLERIRYLDYSKDTTDILSNTARTLGFDITQDFMKFNKDGVIKLVDQLSRFGEISGTPAYQNFVSFVLGRPIKVINLHTRDYETFFEPVSEDKLATSDFYYPAYSDHGTFDRNQPSTVFPFTFQTTHVRLHIPFNPSIEQNNLSNKLVEPIDRDYIQKFIDLFLEFCPINIVVEGFYLSSQIDSTFCLCGTVHKMPTKYVWNFPQVYIDSLTIEGPSSIEELDSATYKVKVVWSNGKEELVDAHGWSTTYSNLNIDKNGNCVCPVIPNNMTVTITATYYGNTTTKDIDLLYLGLARNINNIEIHGPDTADEPTAGTVANHIYQSVIHWSDGTIDYGYTEENWSISSTSLAYIDENSGILSVYNLSSDTPIEIFLDIVGPDGNTYSARKPVLLKNVQSLINRISIRGPNEIVEYQTAEYSLVVDYINKAVEVEKPAKSWTFNSPYGSLSEDPTTKRVEITVTNIDTHLTARLDATYEERGEEFKTYKIISFKDSVPNLDSLEIIGPSIVTEFSISHYSLRATWSDGTITKIKPTWETDYFSIDQKGTLYTQYVKEVQTVNITATFVKGELESDIIKHTKAIKVFGSNSLPESINILSPSTAKEDSVYQLKAVLVWKDGTHTDITDDSSCNWSINPTGLTVSGKDLIVPSDFLSSHSTIDLAISYQFSLDGTILNFNDKKTVYVVKDKSFDVQNITSINIQSEDVMVEYEQYQVTAVTNTGDSLENVRWSVENLDSSKRINCSINDQGQIIVHPLKSLTFVRLSAYFSGFYTTKVLTLKPLEYHNQEIETVSILGPSSLDCESNASYLLQIIWKNCGIQNPTIVGADWYLYEKGTDLEDPVQVSGTHAHLTKEGVLYGKGVNIEVDVYAEFNAPGILNVSKRKTVNITCGSVFSIDQQSIDSQSIDSQSIDTFEPESVSKSKIFDFYIEGPDRIFKEEKYSLTIKIDSGLYGNQAAVWYLDDQILKEAETLNLRIPKKEKDSQHILKAVFEYDGEVYEAIKTIVRSGKVAPQKLKINVPSVFENESTVAQAIVEYDGEIEKDVTNDFSTIWKADNVVIENGVIKASPFFIKNSISLYCEFNFSFEEEFYQYTQTKNVLVKEKPRSEYKLDLTLNSYSLVEDELHFFEVKVIHPDEAKEHIDEDKVQWVLPKELEIEPGGLYVKSLLEEKEVEIVAYLVRNKETLSTSKTVRLKKKEEPRLTIEGPSIIYVHEKTKFTAFKENLDVSKDVEWTTDQDFQINKEGVIFINNETFVDKEILIKAVYEQNNVSHVGIATAVIKTRF